MFLSWGPAILFFMAPREMRWAVAGVFRKGMAYVAGGNMFGGGGGGVTVT